MRQITLSHLLSLGVLVSVVGGCAGTQLVPALLDPKQLQTAQPETTQTLNAAAGTLLAGRRITLGSAAFVTRSRVSLEHSLRASPKGRLATGRLLSVPEELRLVRVGRRCELLHSQSQERVALPGIRCVKEPAPILSQNTSE